MLQELHRSNRQEEANQDSPPWRVTNLIAFSRNLDRFQSETCTLSSGNLIALERSVHLSKPYTSKTRQKPRQ